MVYGEGLPPNTTFGGQQWNFMAGSLDVVPHGSHTAWPTIQSQLSPAPTSPVP
jgi:hypothetical protein